MIKKIIAVALMLLLVIIFALSIMGKLPWLTFWIVALLLAGVAHWMRITSIQDQASVP